MFAASAASIEVSVIARQDDKVNTKMCENVLGLSECRDK